jgi:23S rRNA pseudouridine2457 synthase
VLVLFNKPFQVISQFSPMDEKRTLAEFISIKNIYPAGRLDYDSEGLMALTDDGKLQQQIADPKEKLPKTYWVQVEGIPTDEALKQLEKGVILKDGKTKPATAKRLENPTIWERNPPIRVRQTIPDSWIELTIKEGRNRQVRRMTAAVGFPTLRLIRVKIGDWSLGELLPGEFLVKEK